jgi:uncharacterized membrane protein YgcG
MGSNNPYDNTQVWLSGQEGMSGVPYADPTYYAPSQQPTLVNQPYYTNNNPYAQTMQQSNQRPQHAQSKQNNKKTSDRMPKAQAVSMARTLKRVIVVASIAGFGILSGVVATHLQTITTSQSTSTSASQNTSSNTSSSSTSSTTNSNSNQNSSNVNSGGFFNQQGGGYGFGSGSSSQAPITSSRVS